MQKRSARFFLTLILTLALGACIAPDKLAVLSGELSLCEANTSPQGTLLDPRLVNINWHSLINSEADITRALATMSLKEKVGQMVQTDIVAATPLEVKTHNIGSIINLTPDGKLGTSQAWRNLADAYQLAALQSSSAIPTVFAIDAVHGHSYFDGNAVILPHNIGLGATRNPRLVTQLARLTAKELSATGVRWTFSPTIAVAQNIRWGRTYESFGETTELQQMFAGPMVAGYQGEDLAADHTVGATAKHFVADGATDDGIDRGDASISELEMRSTHLPGFIDAIEGDVVSVMVSFSSIKGEKLHGSKALLTDLLKTELGFKGVVITDWEGIQMAGLSLKQGLDAGIDMFMFAQSWKTSLPAIIALVENGQVPLSRIDDAVTRILKMKLKLGLFKKPLSTPACADSIGSHEHRNLAKQAVRESLVLLKNDQAILPLSKTAKVIVVGSHANNIPYQCGGWTKKWQGAHLDRFNHPQRPVAGATSILDGIKNVIGEGNVIDAGIMGMSELADVAIIVVGETPYAEGFGDRTAAELVLSAENQKLIKSYHDAGKKVITLLISGRPLLVNAQIEQSSAFVAAWLPGSEGQGIAEVLFGDHDFKGTLGFSWPGDAGQIGIQQNEADYAPLYPYGFGLRY
ncbi:MAG: beta-glucosidase [Paraglaciecola sp.]|jgi:beta-glucosidase